MTALPMAGERVARTTSDGLDPAQHRAVAVALFNRVWGLLEADSRTREQDDEMMHAAHASRWHWAHADAPDEVQRLAVGEWQCARVYSELGRGEPAVYHARRGLELASRPGVESWVHASACEGMARALRAAGDAPAFAEWRDRAHAAVAAIEDAEDREVLERDLATLDA